MPTKTETELIDSAGGARPAQGPSSVGLPRGVRDRLSDELIDELLAGAGSEEEIVGPGGVFAQLTKRLVERAMSAELTEHGPVRIETPRDRRGTFEPQNLSKGRRIAVWSSSPSLRLRLFRYFGLLMPILGHVGVRLWIHRREAPKGNRGGSSAPKSA